MPILTQFSKSPQADIKHLTSAQNQPTGDETYSYDAAGNRLSSADVPGTWQYDGNNALVGKGDYTFDYDENGNRILRQLGGELIHYHYDVLNQLTRIEDQNGQVLAEYGYDLFGRRIWKQVDGVRTWFYYTDEGLAAELDGSGAVTRSYGFHPHSFGSSNPLFVKQGEQYYWILNDASGFPVRVVQPDGGVVWAGQHDSFGEVTVDYEALHYPFRFPGQYYDQESDLYYNWHRYYDPDTGRYLSWDPAEDGSNHYLYVENNPTIYVDPDGQKLIWWAFTTFTPQGKALKYAAKFLKAAKKVPGAKKLVNKARKAMRRAGKTGCFVAGTLVQTSEGLLPIEDILVGDLVWSMDSNTGNPGLASVSRIIRSQTVRVIDVRLDDQTLIQTTPEHPFWVLDEGWKEAAEIVPGSRLLRKGSGTPAVISINEKPAIADVYNLEVKGPHAYFVTEGEILVHNADCSGGNGRGYSTGGGKNAQHANRNAREAAKERYEKAKEEYERLKSTPNKSKETKNEMEKAKRTMDKARKDKDFTGENHSKKGKGCR
jgi:RHS repeat-associated protein